MNAIYILTWVASLLSSGGIWGGLMWLRRRRTKPSLPVTKQKEVQPPFSKIWRGGRPDRSPFYVCIMWSLFVSSLIMLITGPMHPSVIDAMDPFVQRVMSAGLFLGSGICLTGSLRGSRFFQPTADLRDCYQMAVLATPANVSTLTVYTLAVGNTVHWNPKLFVLGAGGLVAMVIAHLLMTWELRQEIKRLDERIATAIQVALDKGDARDD